MNIIVLSKSRIEGGAIANKLLVGGADRVSVVCSIAQAEKRIKQINACCLCFHRSFAQDFDFFCAYFSNTFLFLYLIQKPKMRLTLPPELKQSA